MLGPGGRTFVTPLRYTNCSFVPLTLTWATPGSHLQQDTDWQRGARGSCLKTGGGLMYENQGVGPSVDA